MNHWDPKLLRIIFLNTIKKMMTMTMKMILKIKLFIQRVNLLNKFTVIFRIIKLTKMTEPPRL